MGDRCYTIPVTYTNIFRYAETRHQLALCLCQWCEKQQIQDEPDLQQPENFQMASAMLHMLVIHPPEDAASWSDQNEKQNPRSMSYQNFACNLTWDHLLCRLTTFSQ
jgi:hypothetical protein